jgi:hypothetical protein
MSAIACPIQENLVRIENCMLVQACRRDTGQLHLNPPTDQPRASSLTSSRNWTTLALLPCTRLRMHWRIVNEGAWLNIETWRRTARTGQYRPLLTPIHKWGYYTRHGWQAPRPISINAAMYYYKALVNKTKLCKAMNWCVCFCVRGCKPFELHFLSD